MSALATAVSVLLGAAFLYAGVPKIMRTEHYRDRARRWRLRAALLPVIGIVEATGGALLLTGAALRAEPPAYAGTLLVTATMLGAVITHVRIADPWREALPAVVLGALGIVLLAGQL